MVRCTVTSSALVGSSAISSFGIACQPDRDERALAHAAGELVGILLGARGGIGKPGGGERLDHPAVDVLAGGQPVREKGLGDLGADLRDGVEVRHRILRDEPDRPAADAAHHALGRTDEIFALEEDAALRDLAVARQQSDDRHRRRGLAGAGLADDGERLTRGEVEVDALDGVHRAVHGPEFDRDVADLEELRAGGDALGGSGHASILPGGGVRRIRRARALLSRNPLGRVCRRSSVSQLRLVRIRAGPSPRFCGPHESCAQPRRSSCAHR